MDGVLRKRSLDYSLLLLVSGLLLIGLVMVYSASHRLAYSVYDTPSYYLSRQGIWLLIGLAAMYLMIRFDYRVWRRLAIPLMGGVLALLVLVLVFGELQGGARRWLLHRSVQPSEVCKLGVVIYVAAWLASKGDRIRRATYGIIPFGMLIGLIAGLILLEPDFSTALLVSVTCVSMFFAAGAKIGQLLIAGLFGGAVGALLITSSQYRWLRVVSWFSNPFADVWGLDYQAARSVHALWAGGIWGRGLGNSEGAVGLHLVAHTDAVFAIVGEELGFLGAILVIALFGAVAYRGFRIAARAPDAFGLVLGVGITTWLMVQAAIHIGVVSQTVPATGITLPFFSYGGSSLVTCLVGVGLLLSISRAPEDLADLNPLAA